MPSTSHDDTAPAAEATTGTTPASGGERPPHRAALFYLYDAGNPVHIHSNVAVFERWLRERPWLYPPDRCYVVKYEPTCIIPGEEIANPVVGDGLGVRR